MRTADNPNPEVYLGKDNNLTDEEAARRRRDELDKLVVEDPIDELEGRDSLIQYST